MCVNPSWQKDLWAKGLYMRGPREVRERSGVFIHGLFSFHSSFDTACLAGLGCANQVVTFQKLFAKSLQSTHL